jgi:hypothetical protein
MSIFDGRLTRRAMLVRGSQAAVALMAARMATSYTTAIDSELHDRRSSDL